MGNGTIPLSELVYIGNDVAGVAAYLAPGTAGDWFAMSAACLRETGVALTISDGGGAYRTLAQQYYYYDQFINHGGANAAYPGTSNHGWGKAVDINNWERVYSWLLANCGRWGFQNNYSPEGWHYQHLDDVSTAGLPSNHTEQEDDDMLLIYFSTAASADKLIPKGIAFAQVGGGPLTPISSDAYGSYVYFGFKNIISRTGDQIRTLVKGCGLAEWSSIQHTELGKDYKVDVPILTGNILH